MKRTLAGLFVLSVAMMFMANAQNSEQNYGWGLPCSAVFLDNGDIDATITASGNQLVGSPYDPALNAERIPRDAKIAIHFYYAGNDVNGKKVKGDQVLETTIDWGVNAAQHVIFTASTFKFKGVFSIHATPKVPGYNTAKGESIWLNDADSYYQGGKKGVMGHYAFICNADTKVIGKVKK